MSISVVVPVYNEREYISAVIKRVLATGMLDEIVIVDDFSRDGTRDVLKGMQAEWNEGVRLKLLMHDLNKGKGAALRTGFSEVTGDIVIVQDADFEYDPNDYSKLIQPILDGKADVVYGSRFIGGESHRVLFFWHMIGNKLLTFFSNMLTNLNLTDMETGYKAFRAGVLKEIRLESDRFGFEPEITAKVARKRCRIYETSISYAGRTYEEGKKINWKDGIAAFWHIFKFNLLR
ncbi:MAG TPA: glycosyl transferase [Deltaproteobacteria bacterium]|nr:MAG: glycosyl transferase [Deltaproteobacteria bacterium GWA2_55_82]OGQ63316.1 MAG: glycosyl transferase [Deltaproteobacteria bacterium RIFCSPLOWO2_02_FULL_55_12]OIJ73152.1 MAG: glycosyl transferase [Deltaproteobacteria bacterium GWC2_55_46]HBG45593.1 glycosyl transferase [Deltaproteobacteria bacterium]HCY10424.1 glycosyl transferase [Deltaproteobacteria bacterium]